MSAPRSMNELDTPVEFFLLVQGTDAAGAPEVIEQLLFRTYAKEELGTAAEGDVADQDASFSGVTFWIRFRPGVSNTMRVIRNGQRFDVVAVDINRRRQWLRIDCEKVNDGG